ncbi:MAG: PDDEXK nuclease domain-containing protein [Acidobacteria bacterium]|nr:PDDEXK nuclease domain-containing protein [Acidobacteriota bacterium]
MNSVTEQTPQTPSLFDRVVSILEQARTNSVYAVNNQMVIAYWLIGREIVEELQSGDERAEYGKGLIKNLANKLINSYGSGYSVPNLKNFRLFYLTYQGRITQISYPPGSQSPGESLPKPTIVPICLHEKSYPVGSQSDKGFHPNLSWSHYRALMRVENENARDFYEMEAARCGWSKRDLERQIATLYYERMLSSHDKASILQDNSTAISYLKTADMFKDPYILEFLNLTDSAKIHESQLEQALINNLQNFLLELGKGFSFVARQKHIRMGDKSFYVDLVFYNYLIKCFVLIDLKVGELTYQDIGQMDGYLRLYEEQFKVENDNPTIGLILCSKKDDAIVHYSILKDNQKIFASRYKLILPNEEELRKELERGRRLLEEQIESNADAK